MVKLVALFTTPANLAEFNAGFNRFVPLADQLPGLRRVVVSHVHGGPEGVTPYHLIHEMYFDDLPAIHAAMASPEGVAAGQHLWTFAADNVTLFFASHLEEHRAVDE